MLQGFLNEPPEVGINETEVEVQDPRSILVHQMPETNPESRNPEFLSLPFLRVRVEKQDIDLGFRTSAIKYKETKNKKILKSARLVNFSKIG